MSEDEVAVAPGHGRKITSSLPSFHARRAQHSTCVKETPPSHATPAGAPPPCGRPGPADRRDSGPLWCLA